jgi:hypothetical protein
MLASNGQHFFRTKHLLVILSGAKDLCISIPPPKLFSFSLEKSPRDLAPEIPRRRQHPSAVILS